MDPYVCSVCGQTIERDLVLYLKHTDRHIMDEIRKKHPEWAEKDGLCGKCLDHYRKAMGKEQL